MISIHAPTRGATLFNNKDIRNNPDFNPRSHERSDDILSAPSLVCINFNPRSHERSDKYKGTGFRYAGDFNPRSHERSDISMVL